MEISNNSSGVVPICSEQAGEVVLDLYLDNSDWWNIAVDGETIAEVNAPNYGQLEGLPLAGEIVLFNDTDNEVVQQGFYDLTERCNADRGVDAEVTTETTTETVAVAPDAPVGGVATGAGGTALPAAGIDVTALLVVGAVVTGVGGWLARGRRA